MSDDSLHHESLQAGDQRLPGQGSQSEEAAAAAPHHRVHVHVRHCHREHVLVGVVVVVVVIVVVIVVIVVVLCVYHVDDEGGCEDGEAHEVEHVELVPGTGRAPGWGSNALNHTLNIWLGIQFGQPYGHIAGKPKPKLTFLG